MPTPVSSNARERRGSKRQVAAEAAQLTKALLRSEAKAQLCQVWSSVSPLALCPQVYAHTLTQQHFPLKLPSSFINTLFSFNPQLFA